MQTIIVAFRCMLKYITTIVFISFLLFLSCGEGRDNKKPVQNTEQSQDSLVYIDTVLNDESDNSQDIRCLWSLIDIDSTSYRLKGGYTLSIYPNTRDSVDYANMVLLKLEGHGFNIQLRNDVFYSFFSKYTPAFRGIDFDDYFIIESAQYWYLYEKKSGKFIFEALSTNTYDLENNILLYGSQGEEDWLVLLDMKTLKKISINQGIPNDVNNPYLQSFNAINLFKITKVTPLYIELIFPYLHAESEADYLEWYKSLSKEEKPFKIKLYRNNFK